MSGVSTSNNDLDLAAIADGGDKFLARIRELKDAKAALDASLAALSIGKDVVAALQDAQISREAAKKAVDEAKNEAEAILAAASAQAKQIVGEALAEADSTRKAAAAEKAALEADLTTGRHALTAWSDKVKAEAKALMDDAESKMRDAKLAIDSARDSSAKADKLQAELKDAIAAAKAAEDTFNAKLSAMKAAVA